MKLPSIPKLKVPQKVTRALGKLAYLARQSKPDIFIIGGVIVGGTAVVVAVRDTWKNKEKLQKSLDTIHENKGSDDPEKREALSDARMKFFTDLIKSYWKTAVLSGTSVVLIIHGKKLYRRQVVELGAMYAALLESYRQYRMNVVAEYGAEKDQEFMHGLKTVDMVDPDTGEVTKGVIEDERKIAGSDYATYLTEGDWDPVNKRWLWLNPVYTDDRRELILRLRNIQNSCNCMLKADGILFQNTVRKKLGMKMTEAGWHTGWVRGGMVNGIMGDDFVDFGVFPEYAHGKYQLPINRIFLDPSSNQRYPLIDFNVICLDGIWNDIYEYDNFSMVAGEKRKKTGLEGSADVLDRWWQGQKKFEEMGA